MLLVVVLPTYNEAGNLPRVTGQLLALSLPDIELRLLVVDDDSPDGTGRLADDLAQQQPTRVAVLHRKQKRGLGSAYVEGFTKALAGGADLVGQMDSDLSHQPAALIEMCAAIRDADVVIASRYIGNGGVDVSWGWHRKLLSRLANRTVVPTLLNLPVSDATSGYRLWRRQALERIVPSVHVQSSGYGFQVETAYLAHRLGCRIREVPIYFPERDSGESKMTPAVALATIGQIFAIRRLHRRVGR